MWKFTVSIVCQSRFLIDTVAQLDPTKAASTARASNEPEREAYELLPTRRDLLRGSGSEISEVTPEGVVEGTAHEEVISFLARAVDQQEGRGDQEEGHTHDSADESERAHQAQVERDVASPASRGRRNTGEEHDCGQRQQHERTSEESHAVARHLFDCPSTLGPGELGGQIKDAYLKPVIAATSGLP
jgi:hypothetical protein